MLCYLDACVCTPVFVCVGGMVTDVHGCVVNVLVFEKGRIIDLRRVVTTDNMDSFEVYGALSIRFGLASHPFTALYKYITKCLKT